MKSLILLLAFAITTTTYGHPEDPNVIVVSKATELGVHRIERLVTLNKIDPMFITSLTGLKAERTDDITTPYKIYGFVTSDSNNQSSTITMLSDPKGKVISHSVSDIYQPATPVNWPEKDAVTLIEDALHFVLEGWVQYPEVKAFYLGLMSISMTPDQDAQGNLIASFQVTSDDDARILYIRLKTDGTLISHEIK